MGGVPVLLALAVVGVDYGYQPGSDGKIDYIVQVSPEHWEQARDAGEITSVIDPAVRGRVNRIIIRIGDDDLPRDAGSPAAAPDDDAVSSVSRAHVLSPMPPPSETSTNILSGSDDADYVPTPDLLADAGPTAALLSARVLRPDPQTRQEGGGFQLPGHPSDGNGSGDARRNEQQWPSEEELAAQRSASANRNGEASSNRESEGTSDDPLRRLSGGDSDDNRASGGSDPRATRSSDARVQPPSTDPRYPSTARSSETERPGTPPRSSTTGRDDADWRENPVSRGPSTAQPRPDSAPDNASPPAGADYQRRTATPSRGFGAQPMSPVPNNNSGYEQPSRGYGETPASLQPDNRVAAYDRYGRPVNAAGELIPYADSAADRSASVEPPARPVYGSPPYSDGYPDRLAMAGNSAERDRIQAEAARLAAERESVAQYGRQREASVATDTEPSSPSDGESSRKAEQEIAAELAATRAALANADAEKKQSVVSQPVFNFLLLVSLVANAYLILQMSRLLQRYRNMVANMKSTSTSVG